MEKNTAQTLYHHNLGVITESKSDKFIYEVSLYIVTTKYSECVGSKFYASQTLLTELGSQFAKHEDKTVVKHIDLLSAPRDYIIANKLKKVVNEDRKRQPRRGNNPTRRTDTSKRKH